MSNLQCNSFQALKSHETLINENQDEHKENLHFRIFSSLTTKHTQEEEALSSTIFTISSPNPILCYYVQRPEQEWQQRDFNTLDLSSKNSKFIHPAATPLLCASIASYMHSDSKTSPLPPFHRIMLPLLKMLYTAQSHRCTRSHMSIHSSQWQNRFVR